MSTSADAASADDFELSARQKSLILVLLLVFALVLRVVASVYFSAPHYPDEVFQSFEQAHRWAFGSGVQPWEFRAGSRSPVVPALLTVILQLVEPWVGGPLGYLTAVRVLLSALSLLAVAAVYRMGLRESAVHGVIAGFVAASWFEIVYFAGRPLTEAIATTFLLVALSLATPQTQALRARRLVAIGLCIGLCLMLRFQLAPGLLLAAILIARADLSRWVFMAAGGILPVAVFGAADWYVWGTPFISYWRSFAVNVVDGHASHYGKLPFSAYVAMIFGFAWTGVAAIIFVLCMLRWRASLLWTAVAAAIVVTHSIIPHKEYRFIFPATALFAIVAAMSSADILRLAMEKLRPTLKYSAAIRLVCLLWLVTSASLGLSTGYATLRVDRATTDAQLAIAKMPDLCGLLAFLETWDEVGGQTYLHKDVPIYFLHAHTDPMPGSADAFNVIMMRPYSFGQLPKEFKLQSCFESERSGAANVCVFKRPGTCTPRNPEWDINRPALHAGPR